MIASLLSFLWTFSQGFTGFQFDLNNWIGTLGPVGIMVWYIWYTTSKFFPAIYEEMRKINNDILQLTAKVHEDNTRICNDINRTLSRLAEVGDHLAEVQIKILKSGKGQENITVALEEINKAIRELGSSDPDRGVRK